jgi:uncharacterized protein YjbI with pentapeptide repeats
MAVGEADSAPVPQGILEFFRLVDVGKDRAHFWSSLQEWYRDSADGSWRAGWAGFWFPGPIDFARATFVRPVDFSGVTFAGSVSFREAIFVFASSFDGTTFEGDADFTNALFNEPADFNKATFRGKATFSGCRFAGRAVFGRATFVKAAAFGQTTFSSESSFGGATFEENASFGHATFMGRARFSAVQFRSHANFGNATLSDEGVFRATTFGGEAKFQGARLLGAADFRRARFVGVAGFGDAEIHRGYFDDFAVETELALGALVPEGGVLRLRGGRTRLDANAMAPEAGPVIRFGPMSLARVEMGSMHAGRVRLHEATGIEALSLYDVAWPERGKSYRIADEDDLDAKAIDGLTPAEVERLYRGLRKNREDRSDRVEAHRWYFAEMEVGRRRSKDQFTRVARHFYRFTSGYGLSAALAGVSFVVVAAITFLLLSIPWSGICPLYDPVGPVIQACSRSADTLRVVLLAVSFQGLPDDIRLGGFLANVVWLFGRFGGAAMLVSVSVAFRNQISR